jgi:hypothetical protein
VRPPEGLCSPGTGCQLRRPRHRLRLRRTRHFGAGLCGDDTQEPGLRISFGGDPQPHPTERPDRRGRRSSVRFWPSLRHGHHKRPGGPRHRRLSGASGRHGLDRDHGRTGGGAAWRLDYQAGGRGFLPLPAGRFRSELRAGPERRRGTGGPSLGRARSIRPSRDDNPTPPRLTRCSPALNRLDRGTNPRTRGCRFRVCETLVAAAKVLNWEGTMSTAQPA